METKTVYERLLNAQKKIEYTDTEIENNLIELAKLAFNAGFQEGMDTTNEMYTKVSNLLNK